MSLKEGEHHGLGEFLQQETIGKRGISSCYPTSIINSAIAIGAISPQEAKVAHPPLLNALRDIPELWKEGIMSFNTDDPRVADIVEGLLHVEIGYHLPGGQRVYLIGQVFEQVYRDLLFRRQAHVVVIRRPAHAYALVAARGDMIRYVDPLDPSRPVYVDKDGFNSIFQADEDGLVHTTPVRRRVGERPIIVGPAESITIGPSKPIVIGPSI